MEAKRVYGIDLGTTYSCIARIDEHGRPAVIENTESALTTPSVVYFESETDIVVGKSAKDMAKVFPDLVVHTVKRHMGDETWVGAFHGKDYTPQEVSALILRKVVGDAEQMTGEKIEDVVITCPAYFGNVEKEATRQAGVIAGLNVRFIVPEPTAAAFAYGMEAEEGQTIMVYDLGGGTFDITLLRTPGTTLATDGDHNLGGKDWDEDLLTYFGQKFQEETGVVPEELFSDAQLYQDLVNQAETCKFGLSAKTTHKVRIKSGLHNVTVEVTREDFERITAHRLERTVELTKEVFERAREQGAKVETILLVGGSTLMPQVRARLEKEFPSCAFRLTDPNQIVAKGAALIGLKYQTADEIDRLTAATGNQARATEMVAQQVGMSLKGLEKLRDVTFTTVTSKSFGLEVITNNGEEAVQNLVMRDAALPLTVTRPFSTYEDQQTGALLRIMENSHRVTDDGTVPLGDCKETGATNLAFQHSLPKSSPIEVTFSLSLDGILKVEGRDLTTGGTVEASFESGALMTAEQLEAARKRASALQVS